MTRRRATSDENFVRALDTSPHQLLLLHGQYPDKYPFLLQSTAPSEELGRYDILFACPTGHLQLDRPGDLSGTCDSSDTSFLDSLDRWWTDEPQAVAESTLPFRGGWFLFLGYELANEIEPRLELESDAAMPIAYAVRCSAGLIHDHETNETYFVSENGARDEFESVRSDLESLHTDAPITSASSTPESETIEEEPRYFTSAVERAKTHIEAGDVYQANLSRSWTTSLCSGRKSVDVYESLCASNPGPFAGIARWNGTSIISSSPERLLAIRDGLASTRPIAGTRPRSDDRSVDDSLSAELFSHPKERAEHVMLIDLERNDLGRICEPGSVEVDEMMVLESYAHVHHIVSNVRGKLKQGVTPGQAIRAVFPGGTITGCPKVRCMEIISELENGPRGAYTGSFGYLNLDGSLDLNILIRTIVEQDGRVTLRAGSGIVADSEANAELAETRAKAKGLLRALSK